MTSSRSPASCTSTSPTSCKATGCNFLGFNQFSRTESHERWKWNQSWMFFFVLVFHPSSSAVRDSQVNPVFLKLARSLHLQLLDESAVAPTFEWNPDGTNCICQMICVWLWSHLLSSTVCVHGNLGGTNRGGTIPKVLKTHFKSWWTSPQPCSSSSSSSSSFWRR